MSRVCFLLVLLYVPFSICDVSSTVTFELNGGRFGDNIFSCSQAFWLHYRYGFQLLFRPFEYSEALKIHHLYPHLTKAAVRKLTRRVRVKQHEPSYDEYDTLYATLYDEHIDVDWSDTEFVDRYRAVISPQNSRWPSIEVPQNCHSIALHIRCGGGHEWDKKYYWARPLQFPSLEYYVQALHLLLRHLEGNCHVHLFTDDPHPKRLAKKIYKQLSLTDQERVNIVYRKEHNRHDANVLVDFFDMMKFKYLIRTVSRFSLFVELLGTCSVSIYPAKATCVKDAWGTVTDIYVSTFVDGKTCTERLALNQYISSEMRKNGRNALIPLLQDPEVHHVLLHPEVRAANRILQRKLPSCY
jgi:hypothetical protein